MTASLTADLHTLQGRHTHMHTHANTHTYKGLTGTPSVYKAYSINSHAQVLLNAQ